MYSSKGVLLLALLFIAMLLPARPIQAAGPYSENFTDGVANGWTSPHTWIVSSSSAHGNVYGNTSESELEQDAVAVYNDNTWSSDYTLRAKAFSTYGNAGDTTKWGNRVGLVFNYQSPGNYHRVLVNMLGEVRLEKVTNGTPGTAVLGSVLNIDDEIWFDIEIVVRGSQVSVKVHNQQAITNAPVTGLTVAKIGVISQYNLALFDDISVTPLANAIFRSGFDGATIGAAGGCNQGTCIQTISGTDPNTQFTWPVTLWDMSGVMQGISANLNANASNFTNYIRNEIQTVTGPAGSPTAVLYQSIRAARNVTDRFPQDPHYIYKVGESTFQQHPLYVRFWMKLGTASSLGSWRNLLQWKTNGDFRMNIGTATYGRGVNAACANDNGDTYWQLFADNEANSGNPLVTYWEECQKTLPVPHGQWFKLEFFSDRGTIGGTNGRVWVAINGQEIFDVQGERMWGDSNSRINRLMAPQLYTGEEVSAPGELIEQWVDDLEIWDNFPADASPH
jgi:hypothetical protein